MEDLDAKSAPKTISMMIGLTKTIFISGARNIERKEASASAEVSPAMPGSVLSIQKVLRDPAAGASALGDADKLGSRAGLRARDGFSTPTEIVELVFQSTCSKTSKFVRTAPSHLREKARVTR